MRTIPALLLAACTTAPPAASDGLTWLEGTWQQKQEQVLTEERWVLQRDGSFLGAGRVMIDDRLGFSETLSIYRGPTGLHFVAWPTGQDPVVFTESARTDTSITFQQPAPTFPQTVTYERTDPVSVQVTADGPGDKGPRTETWSLTLVPGSR